MNVLHTLMGAADDEEDPEESVRVVEGHAVQFNEYRH